MTREEQAEANRMAFPFAAAMMKACARFSPTLKYAEENGKVIGKPMAQGMPWIEPRPPISMAAYRQKRKGK